MAGPHMITFTRTEKYSDLLSEELTQMRRERLFTDFKISSNNESLPCHRLMIAAHSPVLKAMLLTDMTETATQSINLDTIKPEVLKTILDYMYGGQISFDVAYLKDMIAACDYLQMKILKDICVDLAPTKVEPVNVIPWAKLGNDLDLAKLKLKCAEIMLSKFREVTREADFLAMVPAEVQEYLSSTRGSSDVEQDDVLRAALCWVEHDADNRRTNLESILGQVQLERCTSSAVLDVMDAHGVTIVSNLNVHKLLTKALIHLSSKKHEIPTPRTPEDHINHTLLIIGGQVGEFEGAVRRVCWKLTESQQLVKLCDIPFNDLQVRHSVCRTPLGFAITGGEFSDLCVMYNAATKSWSRLPKLLTKRHAHGSISIRGVLYVLGGTQSGYNTSKSVQCLVLEGGSWENAPDVPIEVDWPGVANINNSVFLLGSGDTKQLFRLDIEKKLWDKLAALPSDESCWGSSMAAVNGQLCVAGGGASIFAWYTPATNTWCMGQKPQRQHLYGPLVYCNKRIVLLGGNSCWSNGTDEVEDCSTEDGSWSLCSWKMPERLFRHHALVLDTPQ